MKNFKYLLLLIPLLFISKVKALTFDSFEVTWYYRNKSNESQLLNVIKQENVPLFASTSEYVNGYTTRVEQTFTKQIQYIVNYQLEMWFSPEQELNYRSDTIQRIINNSYVDSDFKILNVTSNEIWNRSSGTGDTVLRINVSMQVLALNNTNAIRFGVYTNNNISIGFYNHTDEIDYYLVNNVSIEENASASIIDQNNQIINGQNGINNNINNMQDNIINNQNDIAQKQEELQEVCKIISKDNIIIKNKKLNSDGTFSDSNSYGITDYIKIGKTNERTLGSGGTSAYLCWYDSNKNLISCNTLASIPRGELSIPENALYFRTSIEVIANVPQFKICNNGNQAVTDTLDETNQQLGDLNNSLNDTNSSGATNDASNFFSNFTTDTFGLTSIITAPLSLINNLTSSSCSTLSLPLPYLDNKYLELPCMQTIYSKYFGSFFNIYQTITFGIVAYWVIVRIFNQVKDFKNPDHDEIEVLDL